MLRGGGAWDTELPDYPGTWRRHPIRQSLFVFADSHFPVLVSRGFTSSGLGNKK